MNCASGDIASKKSSWVSCWLWIASCAARLNAVLGRNYCLCMFAWTPSCVSITMFSTRAARLVIFSIANMCYMSVSLVILPWWPWLWSSLIKHFAYSVCQLFCVYVLKWDWFKKKKRKSSQEQYCLLVELSPVFCCFLGCSFYRSRSVNLCY